MRSGEEVLTSIKLTHGQKFLFLLSILIIYAFAWVIQNNLFLNWDVTALLQTTSYLIEKHNPYNANFYEPNPPMILYLYLPPVLLHKFFSSINIIYSFRIYIYLLASVSWLLCYFFGKKLFSEQGSLVFCLFLITLASVYLILPLHEFGQRDHLLIILSMPYFLAAAYRLLTNSINTAYAILIGILACAGFCLKPQFWYALFLIEIYICYTKANFLTWNRPETLTLLILSAIYTFSTFIFYPTFSFTILPYILKNYYSNVVVLWQQILFHQIALYSWISILFFMMNYSEISDRNYKFLNVILFIALIGFIFAYYLQRTNYYYHLLPFFSLAILLFTLQLIWLIRQPYRHWRNYLFITIPVFLLFLIQQHTKILLLVFLFNPATCFICLGILFLLLAFIVNPKNIWKNFLIVFLTLFFGYVCYRLTIGALWFKYIETIAIFMAVIFSLLMTRDQRKQINYICTASLAILIFVFPMYMMFCIYRLENDGYKKLVLNKLISFISAQPQHQSVYFISCKYYPIINYTDTAMPQRLDCLRASSYLNKKLYQGDDSAWQQLTNEISKGLALNKPNLIFIDTSKSNMVINGKYNDIDFLKQLLQVNSFTMEWKNYHYLTEISDPSAISFKLRVYQRIRTVDNSLG